MLVLKFASLSCRLRGLPPSVNRGRSWDSSRVESHSPTYQPSIRRPFWGQGQGVHQLLQPQLVHAAFLALQARDWAPCNLWDSTELSCNAFWILQHQRAPLWCGVRGVIKERGGLGPNYFHPPSSQARVPGSGRQHQQRCQDPSSLPGSLNGSRHCCATPLRSLSWPGASGGHQASFKS